MRLPAAAVLALLLFGCIPVTVKFVAANAYTIGIFRLAVATLVLGSVLAARRQLRAVPRADVLRLAIIGLLFGGHWLTLFLGIKISTASIGAIGLSTYGVDLLLLGALLRGERPRLSDMIAVLLAAIGAILVIPSFDWGNRTALGMTLASLSALMYASLPLLHQRWSHIPNATRTLGQFGFALLFFLAFAGKTDWRLAPRDWYGLLFLAVGVTLIGHSLWVRVTTHLPPTVTSIIYYGNIPVAVALSVILLREPLTARTVSGALLIIGGSVLGLASSGG
ncbi:MAG: DMT family transporter, partial [Thermoanaerobaculia bacterium]